MRPVTPSLAGCSTPFMRLCVDVSVNHIHCEFTFKCICVLEVRCVEARCLCWVSFLITLPPYFLRQSLSLNPEFTPLAIVGGQQTTGKN